MSTHDERLKQVSKQLKFYLVNRRFTGLDVAFDCDFLNWFYDQFEKGIYRKEFKNLVLHNDEWTLYNAGNIAVDFAEHLYNSNHWS